MRIVADRYVITSDSVRSGGQGDVVKATDTESSGFVALKLIPRHSADSTHRVFFRREVNALSRLTHPNIVSLLNYGEDEGEDSFFLVFPWYEQGLLDALPPLDDFGWDDFIEHWGFPLIDALAYSHERDIVHRDVKPSNVLVATDLTPKLGDFGISKLRSQIVPEVTVAEYFSRPFAPPDLVGLNSASRDVWGFAATAVRCLTTAQFVDYPDLDAAYDDIDVPREVLGLLRRCTHRDPDERPRNAIVLRAQLREIYEKRRRNWVQPIVAQLSFREGVDGRLVPPPLNKDRDAVERALQLEFSSGSHLRRPIDPNTGGRYPDTLELVGNSRSFRLIALPEKNPTFTVSKINNVDEGYLERSRREAWPVVDEVTWTARQQPPASARAAMNVIMAAIDEHYHRRDDEKRLHDENQLFDKWTDLLSAKVELERGRSERLPFKSVRMSGRRASFDLSHAPESEDLIGDERVCVVGAGRPIGGTGVVMEYNDRTITLAYPFRVANLPPKGELVVDIGAAEVNLQRQREAVINVRAAVSVRPDLRQILLNPASGQSNNGPPPLSWFNPKLDNGKKHAVGIALHARDFFLLEGPPGTGKTSFIEELVRQELALNPSIRILLVSQTHVAVDNALVRLSDVGISNMVRLGREDDDRIAPEARKHLLDAQIPPWVSRIRQQAEKHLKHRASVTGVRHSHAQGAASILEVLATFADQTAVQKQLDQANTGPRSTTDQEYLEVNAIDASELTELEIKLDSLRERIHKLQGNIDVLLGDDLALGPETTEEDYRHAFDAIVGGDKRLEDLIELLQIQAEWFQRVESSRDLEAVLLRQARVVAGTCIGFLSHPAVRDLEFDLCILDEASKATATETLVPMARSRRWVLVGDPSQLPPMQEEVLEHPDLMKKYNLLRADVEHTLFDRLLNHAPGNIRSKLKLQYRMHPAIGDLISECFYRGELLSQNAHELSGWDKLYKPVTWLDTSVSRQRMEDQRGSSLVNRLEVKIIKREIGRLRDAFLSGLIQPGGEAPLRILILTAYRKQMEELRRSISPPDGSAFEIEVNTVDAVQGREADITFYSVVRSNKYRKLGFLGESHWRRVNVALSRSRYGLVLVGDAPFCQATPGPLANVLDYMQRHPDTCQIRNAS